RGGLKIVNCTTPKVDLKNESIRAGLHFKEFNIDQITLEIANFYHGINFEKSQSKSWKNTIDTLVINKGSFQGGGISITNTEIRGGFMIKNIDDCLKITIDNCQVGKVSDINYVQSK